MPHSYLKQGQVIKHSKNFILRVQKEGYMYLRW